MRRSIIAALALAGAVPAAAALAQARVSTRVPAAVAAALADPARADQAVDDQRRHAADLLAFSGVKPGDTVVDFLPGRYYWTRLFGDVVGARGHVVAVSPAFADAAKVPPPAMAEWKGTNITYTAPGTAGQPPADLFWTVQNYHDVANKGGEAALAAFNKAVFAALKPGGTYVVIDHAAPAGSGLRDTGTAHRIDAAAVKAQVIAAGFRFQAESRVLANPADDRSKNVFDPAIRGRTDQFAYRFGKPR